MSFWDAYDAAQRAHDAQRSNALADQQRQLNQTAGNLFAQGDTTGAAGVLARGGDLQNADVLYRQAQAQKVAQAQQVADLGLRGVAALQGLPVEQRSGYFNSTIAPTLQAAGVPPDQIQAWGAGPMDDQHLAAEAALLGQARQKLEFQKVGGDNGATLAIDPYTGKPVATYMTGQAPGTAQPAAAAPSPSPGVPAPTTGVFGRIGQVASQAGANPNEVAYLQRTAQIESAGNPGAVNKRGTRFGVFQYPQQGTVEAQTVQALQDARGNAGILQNAGVPVDAANLYIMHQQGPGGGAALLTADPNANAIAALTPAYKGNAALARQAVLGNGGNPNMTAGQFVALWRQKFLRQPAGAAQPATAPAAGDASPQQGVTETSPGVYTINTGAEAATGGRMATAAEVAAAGLPAGTQAWINPKGQIGEVPKGIADQTGAGENAATSNPKGLTGLAFLKLLPPQEQALVRAYSDGRAPIPTGAALRNPVIAKAFADTAQFDPTFDAANYATRVRTRQAFTSGVQGQNLAAINTALSHAATLNQMVDQLGNVSVPFVGGMINSAKNAGSDPVSGNVSQFNAARTALATELARAFQGGAPHETEIKHYTDMLSPNASPQQIKGALHGIGDLLAGRLSALQDSYNTGMSRSIDGIAMLRPDAAGTLATLTGQDSHLAALKSAFYQQSERNGTPAPEIDANWQRYEAAYRSSGNPLQVGQPNAGAPPASAPADSGFRVISVK